MYEYGDAQRFRVSRRMVLTLLALLCGSCGGVGTGTLGDVDPGDVSPSFGADESSVRGKPECSTTPDPVEVGADYLLSTQGMPRTSPVRFTIDGLAVAEVVESRSDQDGRCEVAMVAQEPGAHTVTVAVYRKQGWRDLATCALHVAPATVCGDGVCGATEDCDSCVEDCGTCVACGDGRCDAGEDCDACAADCGACAPECGNGVCETGEDCTECEGDCGICAPRCGDGTCASDESCATCSRDCGACDTGVYRPFSADSYWNTPIPANAPVDPNNDLYIADAKDPDVSWPPFIRLSGAPDHSSAYNWAYPIYWAAPSDPEYWIEPERYGHGISARIPLGATANAGSDAAIIVYDVTGDRVIELWLARYDSSTDQWSAGSTKVWELSSNGLDRRAAGSDSDINSGHRGVNVTARAIRMAEVRAGAINHRLECFWHATGRPNDSTPWYYWPLVGYESGKGGIVPEGLVLRIKPSVNLDGRGLSGSELVIARAMQQYGCVIGDNDGGTKNSLKLERDKLGDDCVEAPCTWKEAAPDLRYAALEAFAWDDYEFVLGGFDPR